MRLMLPTKAQGATQHRHRVVFAVRAGPFATKSVSTTVTVAPAVSQNKCMDCFNEPRLFFSD